MTGQELREARERMAMTQQSLADALEISRSQLGNYERGIHRQTGAPCPIPRTVELAVKYLLSQPNPQGARPR
jgi:transcriptional regulator with XRE-family HTH domain